MLDRVCVSRQEKVAGLHDDLFLLAGLHDDLFLLAGLFGDHFVLVDRVGDLSLRAQACD